MAINEYKKKRSWPKTPEPTGGIPKRGGLRFVVQKHHASRLHYDFRLEMEGVLRSWAVPKGPSMNPQDKRLAIQVEDHPYDYKDFEGVIPEGNYGAGSVIVWDEGSYEPLETEEEKPVKGKKAQEKLLLKQWKSGQIKFLLHGKKLKGAFALVKTKGMGADAWLLIKHRDVHASKKDIRKLDKSVRSGETVASVGEREDKPRRQRSKTKKTSAKPAKHDEPDPQEQLSKKGVPPTTRKKRSPATIKRILAKAPKAPFPSTPVSPMLATLVDKPFDDTDWEFEVKWDGYRALAYIDRKEVMLLSRNGKSFNDKFPSVVAAARKWNIQAVIDGELVAMNRKGVPEFERIQNWQDEANGKLCYYVFDVVWYEGRNLASLPLADRKAILNYLLPEDGEIIRFSESIAASGKSFFRSVSKLGLEGMVAKKKDSNYSPGRRSKNWLKIKAVQRQEVLITGYTRLKDTPRPFSSLLLGVYEGKKLRYAGKVGTGFSEKEQANLLKRFQSLVQTAPPFATSGRSGRSTARWRQQPQTKVVWLQPKLIAEIKFSEITNDGLFRHPVFIALREDKAPAAVTQEVPDETAAVVMKSDEEEKEEKEKTNRQTTLKAERPILIKGHRNELNRKINKVPLSFTNLNKIWWPEAGYTKGDLIEYYHQVAKYILPYLKERPQSLNRFPNGIAAKGFYQKDVTGKVPDWVEKYPYKVSGERRQKNYMLCNNEAALLFMANLGAIEMNPWSSTIRKPDRPTWCILDIDPDTSNTFEEVITVARKIYDILSGLEVVSYCKTSGATGLHIYIPLAAKYSYDQAQLLAKWIATKANESLPFTSIERKINARKGKVYIDYLQNRPGATVAAPYSVRPRPGATVSMPLHWKEVKKGLKLEQFTIETALQKIAQDGAIFRPVLGSGVNLKKIFSQLDLIS